MTMMKSRHGQKIKFNDIFTNYNVKDFTNLKTRAIGKMSASRNMDFTSIMSDITLFVVEMSGMKL